MSPPNLLERENNFVNFNKKKVFYSRFTFRSLQVFPIQIITWKDRSASCGIVMIQNFQTFLICHRNVWKDADTWAGRTAFAMSFLRGYGVNIEILVNFIILAHLYKQMLKDLKLLSRYGILLKIFFRDSTIKIMPTRDAKASSVNRVKYLKMLLLSVSSVMLFIITWQ